MNKILVFVFLALAPLSSAHAGAIGKDLVCHINIQGISASDVRISNFENPQEIKINIDGGLVDYDAKGFTTRMRFSNECDNDWNFVFQTRDLSHISDGISAVATADVTVSEAGNDVENAKGLAYCVVE